MIARALALVAGVLLVACSVEQKPAAARDTTPAALVDTAVATLSADTTAAPLARDSVVLPADTGVRVGADRRPRFPVIFSTSCEGEDCETTFRAFACAPVDLHASPTGDAAVVARVGRGDSVDVRRTDIHVLRPGMIFVKQPIILDSDPDSDTGDPIPRGDTLRLAAGDTVYLLQYLGLGSWYYWSHGKLTSGAEFWGGPPDYSALGASAMADTSRAVARSQPLTEKWWLVARGGRTLGWWRADSVHRLRSVMQMQRWEDYCPGVRAGEPGGPPPPRPAPNASPSSPAPLGAWQRRTRIDADRRGSFLLG